MAEACNLQQFNKTSSIDELFDNYIKFMRSLKEVIDTAINSLRIINDNGHKFSADRLGGQNDIKYRGNRQTIYRRCILAVRDVPLG